MAVVAVFKITNGDCTCMICDVKTCFGLHAFLLSVHKLEQGEVWGPRDRITVEVGGAFLTTYTHPSLLELWV